MFLQYLRKIHTHLHYDRCRGIIRLSFISHLSTLDIHSFDGCSTTKDQREAMRTAVDSFGCVNIPCSINCSTGILESLTFVIIRKTMLQAKGLQAFLTFHLNHFTLLAGAV